MAAGGSPRQRSLRDPAEMKALAHPTRLALLETLGVYGPMTATEAAGRVGESPSSCSYHLRMLARYGFVEETGEGTGRQRPWRSTNLELMIGEQSEPAAKIAASALSNLYVERSLRRMQAALSVRDSLPAPWRKTTNFTESVLWATPAETRAVNVEIAAILSRYHDRLVDPARRPRGALPVEMLHFSYRMDPLDGA